MYVQTEFCLLYMANLIPKVIEEPQKSNYYEVMFVVQDGVQLAT